MAVPEVVRLGHGARVEGNIINWRPDSTQTETLAWTPPSLRRLRLDKWRQYLRVLPTYLDPIFSPVSPLQAVSRWRIERYYERTLTDRALAERWAAHYLRGLGLAPGEWVLDHGCGSGRHVGILHQLGYRVAAQDVMPFTWWERLPDAVFQVMEPERISLPWRDEAFGLRIDWMVLDQFPADQLSAVASEAARVLRPGGYWVILNANSEGYAASRVRRNYHRVHDSATFRSMGDGAGLYLVDEWTEAFHAPIAGLTINLFRKQLAPWPFDMTDHGSIAARLLPARKRALRVLRFRKP